MDLDWWPGGPGLVAWTDGPGLVAWWTWTGGLDWWTWWTWPGLVDLVDLAWAWTGGPPGGWPRLEDNLEDGLDFIFDLGAEKLSIYTPVFFKTITFSYRDLTYN